MVGEGEGGLEEAEAGGEDLAGVVGGGPEGGGVAFVGGLGGDVVDVDGGGEEEDALDGVGRGGGCHWGGSWGCLVDQAMVGVRGHYWDRIED